MRNRGAESSSSSSSLIVLVDDTNRVVWHRGDATSLCGQHDELATTAAFVSSSSCEPAELGSPSSSASSSSSGIFTERSSSSSSSSCSPDNKGRSASSIDCSPSDSPLSTAANGGRTAARLQLGQALLPIITLYRAKTETTLFSEDGLYRDELLRISDRKHALFRRLTGRLVLIAIGRCEQQLIRTVQLVLLSLRTHLGPLLPLIAEDLYVVRANTQLVQRSIDDALNESHLRKNYFIASPASFVRHSFRPLLSTICAQLHDFIGSNRCFLLCESQLLSSAQCGNDSTLVDCYEPRSFNSIVQSARKGLEMDNDPFCESCWLDCRDNATPVPVDVMAVSISRSSPDGILWMLIISETVTSQSCHIVQKTIEQLEALNDAVGKPLTETDISSAGDAIDRLCQHLNELSPDWVVQRRRRRLFGRDSAVASEFTSSLLRNPQRTAGFIKSLWSRFSKMTIGESGDSSDAETPPPFHSRRLSRLGRASALFSSTVSLVSVKTYRRLPFSSSDKRPSIASLRTTSLSFRADTLLSGLERQLRSLLHEFCAKSAIELTAYKEPLLCAALDRLLPTDQRLTLQLKWRMLTRINVATNSLRPSDLGLDMIAYRCLDTKSTVCLEHCPGDMLEIMEAAASKVNAIESAHQAHFIGGFLVIRLRKEMKRSSQTNGKMTFRRLIGSSTPPVVHFVLDSLIVFSACTHIGLAEHQSHHLLDLLEPRVTAALEALH